MKNTNGYYLISGLLSSLGLVVGTAWGAGTGNIKIGVALGLLGGIVLGGLADWVVFSNGRKIDIRCLK